MFQQVFDRKQIDELAEAQLLWYLADFHADGAHAYDFDGDEDDLPSAVCGRSASPREWKFYILLEE